MYVNTEGLHAGATSSYGAADHVRDASGTLSRASVASGIFGDFDAADSFHEALSDAHASHVTLTNTYSEQLGIIGDKAHRAAADFREMESNNKDRLSL
jgi:Protein of unknown function (DUF2563)